jgi:hypothetical protein
VVVLADTYIERIIKRKADSRQRLARLAIVLGGFVLVMASVVLGNMIGFQLFPIIFALSCFFGYRFMKQQSWEFEYAVTNGEIDVDRIYGQSARKRVVTVDCKNIDVFLPMVPENAGEYQSKTIKVTIDAASASDAEGRWFAIFQGKDGQRTMLVFEPDERMLNVINAALPRRLQKR